MTDMQMRPAHGALHWRGWAYAGTINLQMFGTYEVHADMRMGGAKLTGTTVVSLPSL